ncbi:MAG: diguanylate cyclase [Burkholderiales bacterium]
MPRFYIIPKNDPQQAHRISRYFLAVATSLLVLYFMAVVHIHGYMELRGLQWCASAMVVCFVVFYALFRSGLNLNFRDASLTGAQMISAFVVTTVAAYYTQSDARAVFLPVMMMTFYFGIYRLDTSQMTTIALISIICYGVMLATLYLFRRSELDVPLETLRWWILSVVLLWFSLLSGHISQMRKELADSKASLEVLLERDELTGVGNRRYLTHMLAQEKSRFDRSGSPFCVAMLDLDFFKKVNDTYGHAAGDRMLKTFTLVAQDGLRRIDYFGRYGGEEFMLIMAETPMKGAQVKAERLRSNVEHTRHAEIDPGLVQTVSIGLAEYRRDETIEDLQKRADKALYKAKSSGRNRVEIDV